MKTARRPRVTRPEDLPRGFADDWEGRRNYLLMRIERGSAEHAEILAREECDEFTTLLFEPVDGKLYDVGFEYYGEFICSLDTAARLLDEQTMTVDGVRGVVEVATRFMNGAQMRWLPRPDVQPASDRELAESA